MKVSNIRKGDFSKFMKTCGIGLFKYTCFQKTNERQQRKKCFAMQRLQRRLVVDSNPASHGQLGLGMCKTLILFTKIFYRFQIYIHVYRMAKIYWHITQCNASV